MPKRVLIVDDHKLILDLLSAYIERKTDMEVTCVTSRAKAFSALEQTGPFDVVLVDLRMPGGQTHFDLKKIVDLNGDGLVVLLSGLATYADLVAAQMIGVHSYMRKSLSGKEMVACLMRILGDPTDIPLHMRLDVASQVPPDLEGTLSVPECSLLCLIARGATNTIAASVMGTNEAKISHDLRYIYHKLGVSTRVQAVNALMGTPV